MFYFNASVILEVLKFAKRSTTIHGGREKPLWNRTFRIPTILPNPYFSAGPSFNWFDQAENIGQSLAISYSHHIPIMAINMVGQAWCLRFLQNTIDLQSPMRFQLLLILFENRTQRPILVIESKLDVNMPMARINHWTDGASVVYENDAFKLKRLELSAFDSIVRDYHMKLDFGFFRIPFPFNLKKKVKEEWGYEIT